MNDNDMIFHRRFLAAYAVFVTIAGMAYVAAATFMAIPEANQRVVDTALGFVLGTLLSLPLMFYFSSSKGSEAKDNVIAAMASPPTAPTPTEPTQAPTATPGSTSPPTQP